VNSAADHDVLELPRLDEMTDAPFGYTDALGELLGGF
jgi:hypothetical protein